jgi:hypothetical protein
MKLFDILKQQGLFANDIRMRINNGQININGNVVKDNIELDIELDEFSNAIIIEAGNFICKLIQLKQSTSSKLTNGQIFAIQLKIFGFENLFDSNINNELTEHLNKFIFVKTSKKEFFLLEKKI